jgi:hypothetical protein
MGITSELFRAEQGVDQVNQQAEAGDARNDVVHSSSQRSMQKNTPRALKNSWRSPEEAVENP